MKMGQQYLQRGESFFQGTLHKRARAVAPIGEA